MVVDPYDLWVPLVTELFIVVDSVVDAAGAADVGLPMVFLEPALDNEANFSFGRPSIRST